MNGMGRVHTICNKQNIMINLKVHQNFTIGNFEYKHYQKQTKPSNTKNDKTAATTATTIR